MTHRTLPGPFDDTSTLERVRGGQSEFGVRAARLGRRAAASARTAGVFFTPSVPRSRIAALYLHGGGYVSGAGEYARGVAALLCEALGTEICAADYRLAPEHPYPAALDDAEGAYRALLRAGVPPERLALLGDSSGGGLCFALLGRLKRRGAPLPAAVIALSPWADLTLSALAPDASDGLMDVPLLDGWAKAYAGGADRTEPELSPLLGELRGFPPALLFAGAEELLRSDAERLAAALAAADVPCRLVVAPGMGHTYPLCGAPESRRALEIAAAFLAAL